MPIVLAVAKSPTHQISKKIQSSINLLKGLGVEGDAHAGKTVKHRSRVAQNPNQPNFRQVHLIHSELFEELRNNGFEIYPGQMGENITTKGINLLGLPTGTTLSIGPSAIIEITGLRNPCTQLDSLAKGLMKAVLSRNKAGNLIRKAGVMGIVVEGGIISSGDQISIKLPPMPHLPLDKI